MSIFEIHCGDALAVLRTLESESVQVCVTSPPYWGLRTYSTEGQVWGGDTECEHQWGHSDTGMRLRTDDPVQGSTVHGNPSQIHTRVASVDVAFCQLCGAWRGELGLEPTPELYVEHMVEIFREVKRVLRRDGVLFLNLGDSYVAGPTGHQNVSNANGKAADMFAKGGRYRLDNLRKDAAEARDYGRLKPKDLVGIPWRVAFALQADGWWLRSEITWCKRAPMPESVRDRPTSATEKVFLFAKQEKYFYDPEAVREPAKASTIERYKSGWNGNEDRDYVNGPQNHMSRYLGSEKARADIEAGRNMWNYWLLSPDPFPEAHFATFPRELARRCILAGSSEHGACGECGAPYRRVVERGQGNWEERKASGAIGGTVTNGHNTTHGKGMSHDLYAPTSATVGWQPTCAHHDSPIVPCVVLDPFTGSGTTGLVAVQHGRRFVGVELNPDYVAMSIRRIGGAAPLFTWAASQQQEQEEATA